MELYDAMSTLRAVRRLRTDPIPKDVMDRVLQAACWAPTGGNQQPWRVVVATSPEVKQGLADLYQPEWATYSANFRKRMDGMEPDERDRFEKIIRAGDHLADNLAAAPAILIFCANPKRMAITDAKLDRISMVGGGSVYPAVQNLMLACVQEGLGCTLTTLHCFREAEVKELLDVPDSWATVALIPIGYPVGRGHGPITRQPPNEMAYKDRFGDAWPD